MTSNVIDIDNLFNLLKNNVKGKDFTSANSLIVLINDTQINKQLTEEDILEEIAAAVAAIKMYIISKNNKNGKNSSNLNNSRNNGNNSQRYNHLWYRTWLDEITRSYDINPYSKKLLHN